MEGSDGITELPAEMEWLLAREEIAALLHRYAWHFDRNEPEQIAELFAEDAIIDYGPEFPPIRGRSRIAGAIRPGLQERFAATSHHISNLLVVPAGSHRATGTAYVYAWHRYRDGSPDGYLWGQYRCGFVRDVEGWRIQEMVLAVAGTVDFHRAAMHPIGRRE